MEAKLTFSQYPFLKELDLAEENVGVFDGKWEAAGEFYTSMNPSTLEPIAKIKFATEADFKRCLVSMEAAKKDWGLLPAPVRGEVVRKIGVALRAKKEALGQLVSLEMGKIKPEGLGEVQEAIDICDYALGLSRALNGSVIPSERPDHFMMERWNPLKGHVGVITAFNFPVAVYFWNVAISLVCGNTNLWKPASSVSLVAVACTKIVSEALKESGVPGAICTLCCGSGRNVGQKLIEEKSIELLSFTGSTDIGRRISETCAKRFGKTIMELGGNNAMIVMDDAKLDLALRACLFAAVGTAGQRCTTLRRLLVHEKVYDKFVADLVRAYKTVKIGNPLEEGVLCGPLHNKEQMETYVNGIERIKKTSGKILVGGNPLPDKKGYFVEPTIVEISHTEPIIQEELFVPILYVVKIKDLDQAIEFNNSVPQGLSSALFTTNQEAVFKWTGPTGSDCGIVNINIGPSGAEIGGAFGGEKETGGGRESGSDAWKQYCRRSTCTVNYGKALPLAQGIKFD